MESKVLCYSEYTLQKLGYLQGPERGTRMDQFLSSVGQPVEDAEEGMYCSTGIVL